MCDETCRVACLSGHVFLFEANVPQPIPEHAVKECRAAGCFPARALSTAAPATAPAQTEPVDDDPVMDELQVALAEIRDSGDPNYMTAAGMPRKAEVQKRVTADFTGSQLKRAWDLLTTND